MTNFSARTGSPFTLFDCTNAAYVFCPRVSYDQPFKRSTARPPQETRMNSDT